MKLLKDKDLYPLLVGLADPIIKNLPLSADWYSKDSAIQPSSLDLHVGNIYEPGKKKDEKGGESNPLSALILEPGHTAIVGTLEDFNLPDDIAGIAFPPSRISFQGILMTNPGHIDPGYHGKMRLTVINMGKQKFVLRSGDLIITLLLIQLSENPTKSWKAREGGGAQRSLSQDDIDRLSADFLDVEKRAEAIAKRIAGEAVQIAEISNKSFDSKIKWYGVIATIAVVVINGFFALWQSDWKVPVAKVEAKADLVKAEITTQVDLIRKDIEFLKINGDSKVKADQLEIRLKDIERRLGSVNQPSQSPDTTLRNKPK